MEKISFVVDESMTGKRLDVVVTAESGLESRSAVQKLIRDGFVLVSNAHRKAGYRVCAGDNVEVILPDREAAGFELEPWEYPLEVLYEDEHLLAIHKPAHMVTHPGAGNRRETAAAAVLQRYPSIRNVGHPLRPGVVHRLDKETSGVLLFAKSEPAYHRLSTMFKERRIEKHYRALAFGMFRQVEGKIDRALGRDPRDRKKISVRARKSRHAVTFYRVLKQLDYAALLDVRIVTGRTHQIRVHLSSLHHPVVGDLKYGGGNWSRVPDPQLRQRWKEAAFFGLHAFSLDFAHPFTDHPVHIEAKLPPLWP